MPHLEKVQGEGSECPAGVLWMEEGETGQDVLGHEAPFGPPGVVPASLPWTELGAGILMGASPAGCLLPVPTWPLLWLCGSHQPFWALQHRLLLPPRGPCSQRLPGRWDQWPLPCRYLGGLA